MYGPGDSITVAKGDRFIIALRGQPDHRLRVDGGRTTPTSSRWSSKQVAGGTMPGAGGTQDAHLRGHGHGFHHLVLNYARSFEPDQPPAQTEKFPVKVR